MAYFNSDKKLLALEKRFSTPKKKKRHKYKAKKATSRDGHSFPSQLERRVYEYLKFLEKSHTIKILKMQVNIHLTQAKILYIPDFLILELNTNQEVYVEAKGFETPVWRIKRRLWKSYGPGRLQIYKTAKNQYGCQLVEEIIPEF